MKKAPVFCIILSLAFASIAKSQDFGDKPFSNPGFMMGTNLGKHLQVLYRQNRIDEMLKFTATETLKKYGREKVREYYANCGFGFEIRLRSVNAEGNYRILSFDAKINATSQVVRMKSTVENDTAKVVLENLRLTY